MTEQELIVKQQLRIEELLLERQEWLEVAADIRLSLVCISGPLNDNAGRYTEEQLVLLRDIYGKLLIIYSECEHG